jgi:hypothetical protein
MRSRSLLGLAAVAVMLLTPAPLPMRAQQAPTPQPAAPPADQAPAPPSQPSFRVEANFVRVDVYPTNGKGEPVTDLTADDF